MNNDNPLHLGYLNTRVERAFLSLSEADRRRHIYVIGQTGSGKTTFLKSCILQDIMSGRGVALLDPHGDLAEDIIDAIPSEPPIHIYQRLSTYEQCVFDGLLSRPVRWSSNM